MRSRNGVAIDATPLPEMRDAVSCIALGCTAPARARGYCHTHYERLKHGRQIDGPVKPRSLRGAVGVRFPGDHGYMMISVPKGTPGAKKGSKRAAVDRILEHRYVMQQHLGRPLLETETVHHKDGNRANNDISNLELRAGAHGVGIRVDDGALAHIAYFEQYIGLDLADRAFLARLREKAEKGLIWHPESKKKRA